MSGERQMQATQLYGAPTWTIRPVAAVFATMLAVAIAGCAAPPVQEVDLGDYTAAPRDLIGVSSVTDAHVVRAGKSGMSTAERDRLDAFIARLAANRPESLRVTLRGPAGSAAMRSIATRLAVDGVDPQHIALAGPSASPPAPRGAVVVAVERAIAVQPSCPGGIDHPSAPEDNRNQANFGCSDVSNFAAMVADPHHLIVGASSIYHDGGRGAEAVAAHRADKVKDLPAINEQFTVIPAAH